MAPSVDRRWCQLLALVPLLTLLACLGCAKGKGTGGCKSDSDCLSGFCSVDGECVCDGSADCPAGQVCGQANCMPGLLCGGATTCLVPCLGDSGCYSNYLVSGARCPAGTSCNQADGNCELTGPPVRPTCGLSDPLLRLRRGLGPGAGPGRSLRRLHRLPARHGVRLRRERSRRRHLLRSGEHRRGGGARLLPDWPGRRLPGLPWRLCDEHPVRDPDGQTLLLLQRRLRGMPAGRPVSPRRGRARLHRRPVQQLLHLERAVPRCGASLPAGLLLRAMPGRRRLRGGRRRGSLLLRCGLSAKAVRRRHLRRWCRRRRLNHGRSRG